MKNLLLSLAVAMIANVSYSQLYVTPNNNGTPGDTTDDTPSYVFVKNQLLFVEQDVNLVENTNTTTQLASIYLRDESQLLQGNTASANSG
ncbi:MAG TPA: hypothetical protein DCS66_11090, partial [Flavobacteriaceae bacterium]|nr:hypothetical protein [Flavobacteriaceae bacterium]